MRFLRFLPILLIALALFGIQALIGGVRMVFSLPAYILLAGGVFAAAFVSREQNRPAWVCAWSAILLAGWVVARALTSPVAYLARPDLLMVLAALLVYLATVMHFRGQKTRLILAGIFMVLAVIHAGIGAVQFKQRDNFMLLPGIRRPDYEWRASGFYICPNHLAGLLEMTGLLALGVACWGNFRARTRVLAGYCALMCFAGEALTGSRGGYLSVVFGLGVFAIVSLWAVWLMRRGGFMLTLASILVGATIVIGGGFMFMSQSQSISDRLSKIYDPQNMRVFLWKGALEQYHLDPIKGTGSGTTIYYARQFRSPEVQNDPLHAHEDYLELLAEYGLVGASLFGVFLLVHLGSGLAGLRKIVKEQIRQGMPSLSGDLALNIGALSAIGSLLFHSLVDFNMHIPANALFVAFLFALLATPVSVSPELVDPIRPAGWGWRGLSAALSLVLLGLSARFWPGEIFAEKARVALRDDRNTDARDLARQGIAWDQKNPSLYGYLGEALHFLTLTAPDPASARLLHESSVAAYADGLRLFPQDTNLLLRQAQNYDLLGDFGQAEGVFRQLFIHDPEFQNVYAYYGLHWQLQRQLGNAEKCFQVAQQLGERDISTRGLQKIEQVKNDPVGQALLRAVPDAPLDLPAERSLPKP